jgi:hypothetical protein
LQVWLSKTWRKKIINYLGNNKKNQLLPQNGEQLPNLMVFHTLFMFTGATFMTERVQKKLEKCKNKFTKCFFSFTMTGRCN